MNRRKFLQSGLGGLGSLAALGLGGSSLLMPSLGRNARAGSDAPLRFVLFYTAQGTVPSRWRVDPEGNGAGNDWVSELAGWSETDFSPMLRPLHAWRDRVSVFDGLGLVSAEADGSGFRHERAQAHSITGADAVWVGGFPYAGAPTIDQLVAESIARADRYRSIELSVSNGLAYDGYGSVIYRGANQALPAIDDPRVFWDRLFGLTNADDPITARQGSVMDAVSERYASVSGRLSAEDRQKLEVHQQLVRSLEQQIVGLAGASCGNEPARAQQYGDYDADFEAHVGLMTAALSCDLTRVASIQMGQLSPDQLGAPAGDVHAEYAHGIYDDPAAADVMTEYGRVHAQHFARILSMLDSIPEAGGTMLDNTVVLWMSEMADSWHGFDTYPAVIAGGGGRFRLGRHIHYARTSPYDGLSYDKDNRMGIPHQKLLSSVLTGMGIPTDSMPVKSVTGSDGSSIDCTGTLAELLP
ncbi:MAG: DUF1552 domain-containing protein [Myxococcota bacterium]